MSETKLLPCTHCENGKAVLHVNELTDKYHVVCCDCGCRTADFKYPEEAIAQWNTRKPMERILTRLEEKQSEFRQARHGLSMAMYTDEKAYNKARILTQKELVINEAKQIVEEEGGIE